MSAESCRMTGNDDTLFDLMEKPELARLWSAGTPAFLWRRSERRIIWANAAALALWQFASLADLRAQPEMAERQPAFAQIDRLAYRLAHNGVQLERLRFYAGGRDLNLLCRCEWRNNAVDRLLLVSATSSVTGLGAPGSAVCQAKQLLDGHTGEAMAVSSAGEVLATTPAMQRLLETADGVLQQRLLSLVREAPEGERRARIDLDGRTRMAHVLILPGKSGQLSLIRLLNGDLRPAASGIEDLIDRLQQLQLARPATPEETGAEPTPPHSAVTTDDTTPQAGPTGDRDTTPAAVGDQVDTETAEPVMHFHKDLPPSAKVTRLPGAPKLQPISGSPNVYRLTTGAPPQTEPPKLQGAEHAAFRELARALGARLESDLDNAEGTETVVPEPIAANLGRDGGAAADPADMSHLQKPSAEELIGLLERAPIALLVFAEGKPVFANRSLLDMFRFADVAALHALSGVSALLPQISSESGLYPARLVARRSDGELFHVIARLRAITWAGERAMLLSMREPDQEAAEQAAISAEHAGNGEAGTKDDAHEEPVVLPQDEDPETTAAALRLTADAVLVLDASGAICSIDRKGAAFLGGNADALAGRPLASIFSETTRSLAHDYLDGLMQHGLARLIGTGREVAVRRADGSERQVQLRIDMLGTDTQRRYCAVLQDITAWKHTEQELRAARKAAEDASAQKSEFLARVSHEIRTPLNSIIGFSEMMIEEGFQGVENERYRAYLRDIHDSGKLLLGVINDLLDLSKIEAGKMELDFASVDVNEVARRALSAMQPEAGRGKIMLRSSLATDLPHVVADQRSLLQVLLNLLSNAIKFTEPGGQVILSTTLTNSGDVQLRVRDTGVGMDQEQLKAALEPFRQIPRALPTRVPGTGLGLPLTRALVEANRARFDIDSTPGVGTLSQVTFPPPRVLAE